MRILRWGAFVTWLIVAGLAIAGFAAFSPQRAPDGAVPRAPEIAGDTGPERGAATGRVLALAFAVGTREPNPEAPTGVRTPTQRATRTTLEGPPADARPETTTTTAATTTSASPAPTTTAPSLPATTTSSEPTVPVADYQWPSGSRCDASWYGPGFEGQPTASGELFDPRELTAALHDVPFGTRVIVTNVETGARVTVRINDRGPFVWDNGWQRHSSRCIDLSRAAMNTIAATERGVVEVTITY